MGIARRSSDHKYPLVNFEQKQAVFGSPRHARSFDLHGPRPRVGFVTDPARADEYPEDQRQRARRCGWVGKMRFSIPLLYRWRNAFLSDGLPVAVHHGRLPGVAAIPKTREVREGSGLGSHSNERAAGFIPAVRDAPVHRAARPRRLRPRHRQESRWHSAGLRLRGRYGEDLGFAVGTGAGQASGREPHAALAQIRHKKVWYQPPPDLRVHLWPCACLVLQDSRVALR